MTVTYYCQHCGAPCPSSGALMDHLQADHPNRASPRLVDRDPKPGKQERFG